MRFNSSKGIGCKLWILVLIIGFLLAKPTSSDNDIVSVLRLMGLSSNGTLFDEDALTSTNGAESPRVDGKEYFPNLLVEYLGWYRDDI